MKTFKEFMGFFHYLKLTVFEYSRDCFSAFRSPSCRKVWVVSVGWTPRLRFSQMPTEETAGASVLLLCCFWPGLRSSSPTHYASPLHPFSHIHTHTSACHTTLPHSVFYTHSCSTCSDPDWYTHTHTLKDTVTHTEMHREYSELCCVITIQIDSCI